MKFHWHSTVNPDGPECGLVKDTFQDVDLRSLLPGTVDRLDAFCIEHEMKRSEALSLFISEGVGTAPRIRYDENNVPHDEHGPLR